MEEDKRKEWVQRKSEEWWVTEGNICGKDERQKGRQKQGGQVEENMYRL